MGRPMTLDSLPVSSRKVQSVTKLALKYAKYHKLVVYAVEKTIHKAKSDFKLPLLYMIDSILKHSKAKLKEKDVYGPRFGQNLARTFASLLKCSSEHQQKMKKVVAMWESKRLYKESLLSTLIPMQDTGPSIISDLSGKSISGDGGGGGGGSGGAGAPAHDDDAFDYGDDEDDAARIARQQRQRKEAQERAEANAIAAAAAASAPVQPTPAAGAAAPDEDDLFGDLFAEIEAAGSDLPLGQALGMHSSAAGSAPPPLVSPSATQPGAPHRFHDQPPPQHQQQPGASMGESVSNLLSKYKTEASTGYRQQQPPPQQPAQQPQQQQHAPPGYGGMGAPPQGPPPGYAGGGGGAGGIGPPPQGPPPGIHGQGLGPPPAGAPPGGIVGRPPQGHPQGMPAGMGGGGGRGGPPPTTVRILSRTLWLGRMEPENCTDRAVREMCEMFGRVDSLSASSNGQAFCVIAYREAAENAREGILSSRNMPFSVKVGWAKGRGQKIVPSLFDLPTGTCDFPLEMLQTTQTRNLVDGAVIDRATAPPRLLQDLDELQRPSSWYHSGGERPQPGSIAEQHHIQLQRGGGQPT